MNDNALFFIKVKELCKSFVHRCAPHDRLQTVAELMKKKNVSGIIVTENEFPVGVITDRDFRNKVILGNLTPAQLSAADVMTSPLVTIGEDEYVFEAIYRMTKHNIHRLAVTDEMGKLTGVITDTDIIQYHTQTPLYFIRDLEHAGSLDELKAIDGKVKDLAAYLVKSGVKTRESVRFISHINDSITLKVIEIILKESYAALPADFAFLVLGSEGRMEQTLKTDQDNAIVYSDTLSQADITAVEAFSVKLIDGLLYIGVPPCPGGTMAKNPAWRRSLQDWKQAVAKWIDVPLPDNILNYSMFSDLRTIYGNPVFEKEIKEVVRKSAEENTRFLAHMAQNALRFPPPVGFFGNFKVEKKGEHTGRLDIKKAGIFPITEGVKILALESGIMNGGTIDKIQKLMETDLMPRDQLLEIETSFNFFVQVRLKNNLNQLSRGENPTNYVHPGELNHIEQQRLKIGFSVVKSLQNFLREKYSLDFMAQ